MDLNTLGYLLGALLTISMVLLAAHCHNPFKFPYKVIEIDITSKRKPNFLDFIDKYLIEFKFKAFLQTMKSYKQWKAECEKRISTSLLKAHRRKQYLRCIDEKNMFKFEFYRIKTRYKQVKYKRYPYYVKEYNDTYATSFKTLWERFKKLKAINFECTLKDYENTQQRKLMTKELRTKVAIRDNYTCQKCGKHMPDGVGLQIDHIVPVSKGGKSVISNLQVLCSKCNGAKSDKIHYPKKEKETK